MIPRTLFSPEHEAFRATVRRFVTERIAPQHARWEEQGYVDREVWLQAGAAGLLCTSIPETYGGAGADRLASVVVMEELAAAGASGPGFGLHSEIVAPYLLHYGTEEQKRRFLPRMARGEVIGAIAMTEPSAGSDLQGIRTTARRDGDCYVLNGAKTFITNGWLCDLVIVVAKTDPAAGAKGISLLLVERGMEGFEKGQRLKKVGLKAQDTAELFFRDVRVPAANLLGREGEGFIYLMQQLPWERLQIAVMAVATARAALQHTIAYVGERRAFGTPIGGFQNTRYTLADVATEIEVGQVFVDRCLQLLEEGKLDSATASMAKLWCSEMQFRAIDACVQLHGGYGYMWEYPVTRLWADARVQRIYGGTSEIMKELIARSLGLPEPGRRS
ncbi:MAG: acyl-CoA dehydrogenase family protein [Sutterellaceae bacterium]|nr:acyl-CoA dehydrogenase family protein [Burkholderiaceae bacterium]MDW8429850.1 acyl-CoA dehydrogenase family protein [Sutterellaceae bacterium]